MGNFNRTKKRATFRDRNEAPVRRNVVAKWLSSRKLVKIITCLKFGWRRDLRKTFVRLEVMKVSSLTLTRPMRRKLRRFFKSDVTDPFRFLMRIKSFYLHLSFFLSVFYCWDWRKKNLENILQSNNYTKYYTRISNCVWAFISNMSDRLYISLNIIPNFLSLGPTYLRKIKFFVH